MKNNIGQKLKRLRLKIGIGQRQFAEKIGVSRSGIAQIESGKTCPSFELIDKVYNFYKIDPAYFFETEKNKSFWVKNSEVDMAEKLSNLFTGLSLLTIEIQENGGAVPFNAHDGLLALSQVIEMLSETDKNRD